MMFPFGEGGKIQRTRRWRVLDVDFAPTRKAPPSASVLCSCRRGRARVYGAESPMERAASAAQQFADRVQRLDAVGDALDDGENRNAQQQPPSAPEPAEEQHPDEDGDRID